MAAIGATNCTFIECGALKFLISDSPTDTNLPVRTTLCFVHVALCLASYRPSFAVIFKGNAEAQSVSPRSRMRRLL
jgi:hypothetical protein